MKLQNYILGAFIVATFIYITAFEKDSASSGEKLAAAQQAIPEFIADRVERVTFASGFTLERLEHKEGEKQKWRFAKGEHEVDLEAIAALMSRLEYMQPKRRLGALSTADKKKFALEKTDFHVILSGAKIAVALGKKSEEGAYLRANGNGFFVDQGTAADVGLTRDHYRRHQPCPDDFDEVLKLQVHNTSQFIASSYYQKELEWFVQGADDELKVDPAKIGAVIEAFRALEFTKFLSTAQTNVEKGPGWNVHFTYRPYDDALAKSGEEEAKEDLNITVSTFEGSGACEARQYVYRVEKEVGCADSTLVNALKEVEERSVEDAGAAP